MQKFFYGLNVNEILLLWRTTRKIKRQGTSKDAVKKEVPFLLQNLENNSEYTK